MRLLDLFCGAGGASMGYCRAGFEVFGVDHKAQKHYPFPFMMQDALEILKRKEWIRRSVDAIHASPPCQGYSIMTPEAYKKDHPQLIHIVRQELQEVGLPYVIENVEGARDHMIDPIRLCGTMFDLPLWRHRRFETSFKIHKLLPPCNHSIRPILVTGTSKRKGQPRKDALVADMRRAMDISWMTKDELGQAIPPIYTQWIGEILKGELRCQKK